MKNSILRQLFWLIASILFLNGAALVFHWYFTIPWFDMIIHFLGGFWVVLMVVWLWYADFAGLFGRSGFKAALLILSAVLLIGLLWEVFEFGVGFSVSSNQCLDRLASLADPISDLIMDLLGGLLGTGYLFYRFRKHRV